MGNCISMLISHLTLIAVLPVRWLEDIFLLLKKTRVQRCWNGKCQQSQHMPLKPVSWLYHANIQMNQKLWRTYNGKSHFNCCLNIAKLFNLSFLIFFFFFNCFLGSHLRHVEVPRLGVKLELQLQAHVTARAMQDLSHDHSSWQCQILDLLSEARDRIHILMDPS